MHIVSRLLDAIQTSIDSFHLIEDVPKSVPIPLGNIILKESDGVREAAGVVKTVLNEFLKTGVASPYRLQPRRFFVVVNLGSKA